MVPSKLVRLAALVPPFSPWSIACLCLLYACLGIVGHDPWKSADAINLVIAHAFATSSETQPVTAWLLPLMAGEPWLSNPPLFHWLAATAGNLLGDLLPWHDAARLVSAAFTGLGLLLIAVAARGFHGREASLVAPLLAIGSLGLLIPAHEAQPALVGFAATAGTLAALAWWPLFPRRCALGLGAAIGVGFLGSGLDNLLLNLVVVLCALTLGDWRRISKESWLLAIALAGALTLAWPFALRQAWPTEYANWLSDEVQRLLNAPSFELRHFELLIWGTWPVLPLAVWAAWLNRRQLLLGRHFITLIATIWALLLYFLADDANDGVPVAIAALAVMGSAEAGRLRRGAANAFDWFGCITLTLFMALIWLAGISILTGHPARIAKNFTKFTPEFDPTLSVLAIGTALIATAFWIIVLVATPRTPWRPAGRWAAGIVCVWALISSLLMPWVDHEKSYRSVATQLQRYLTANPGCIAHLNLGTAQRASLAYFTDLRERSQEAGIECTYRLQQTGPGAAPVLPGWQWVKDFARPGDRKERWRLYQRTPDTA